MTALQRKEEAAEIPFSGVHSVGDEEDRQRCVSVAFGCSISSRQEMQDQLGGEHKNIC